MLLMLLTRQETGIDMKLDRLITMTNEEKKSGATVSTRIIRSSLTAPN